MPCGAPSPSDRWPRERVVRWGQAAYWHERIDRAIGEAHAADCNRCITVAHQELALALHAVTGAGSGANFHTWAVWGSRKAGSTIRQEEVPWFRPAATGTATASAGLMARRLHRRHRDRPGIRRTHPRSRRSRARILSRSLPSATAAAAGLVSHRYTGSLLNRASARILEGNVTVLNDIGRQTGRFVSTFWEPQARTEANLEAFLAELRPGDGPSGGQDLLRTAYRSYLAAAAERDEDRRDEHMLLANLSAILHEHWRLDRFIDQSLPRAVRRLVTHDLLDVTFGSERLRIGADVPVSEAEYPLTLATIENAELRDFLAEWDRTPDTTAGSGARDWTDIHDRMNFIVDLFRSRHHDPQVFTAPYPDAERDRILALDRLMDRSA